MHQEGRGSETMLNVALFEEQREDDADPGTGPFCLSETEELHAELADARLVFEQREGGEVAADGECEQHKDACCEDEAQELCGQAVEEEFGGRVTET